MLDLIKRYFWVLGAVVVFVCAIFAAKATSHIVEAKYLNDSPTAPMLPVVAPNPMTQVKATRSKDGTPFAQRDMFCSDCTPPVETVSSIDPSSVITTSLPLQLVATSVSFDEEHSSATIINTEKQNAGGRRGLGRRAPVRDRQRHQEDRRQPLRDRQVARRQGPREPDGRREGRACRARRQGRQARWLQAVRDPPELGVLEARAPERRHVAIDQRVRPDLGRQGARGLHQAPRSDVLAGHGHPPRQARTDLVLDPVIANEETNPGSSSLRRRHGAAVVVRAAEDRRERKGAGSR